MHPTFWLSPWYRHPYQVVKYWRAFLAEPKVADWGARVRITYDVAWDMYQAESGWEHALREGADAIQARSLDKVRIDLDHVGAALKGVRYGLGGEYTAGPEAGPEATTEVVTLWRVAALPLAYAPGGIIERLVSIRNQLMVFGTPEATIVTGADNRFWLPDWGAPSWPADAFRKAVAASWVAAEKSAPGEVSTSRDIAEAALEAALDAAEVAYETAATLAKKGARALGTSLDWAPLAALGAFYLWTRKG